MSRLTVEIPQQSIEIVKPRKTAEAILVLDHRCSDLGDRSEMIISEGCHPEARDIMEKKGYSLDIGS